MHSLLFVLGTKKLPGGHIVLVPCIKVIQRNCQCICLTPMEPLMAQCVSFVLEPKQGAVSSGEYQLTLQGPAVAADAAAATQVGARGEDKRAFGSGKCHILPSYLPKWWEHSVMMRTDVGSNPVWCKQVTYPFRVSVFSSVCWGSHSCLRR